MRHLAKLVSIVSVCAAVLGYLYLWGYWGRFGINFLEFATLTDLVRLSLYPLIGGFLFGVLFQLHLLVTHLPPADCEQPAKTQAAFRRWQNITIDIAVPVVIIALFVWVVVINDMPLFWPLFGVSFGYWLAQRLAEASVSIPTLSRKASAACVFLAVASSAAAYGTGAWRAKMIDEAGASPSTASVPVWSGGEVLLSDKETYLGTLGQFAFFSTDDDSVLIAKWDQISPIVLRRGKRPVEKQQNNEPSP